MLFTMNEVYINKDVDDEWTGDDEYTEDDNRNYLNDKNDPD